MSSASGVLVRAPNWLGDAVMSLPAVEALRAATRGEHLAVLARPVVADIYRLSGHCDDVIVLPGPRAAGGWRAVLRTARGLRAQRFRLGFVLPNSFESALTMRLAGVGECVGYARDGRGLLLHRAVALPAKGEIPRHEAYYYLEMLRRLGIAEALPKDAVPRLQLSASSLARGREVLARAGIHQPPIAVSPGAANSRAKQWPPDFFAEAACQAAVQHAAPVALFGTPTESQLCDEIAQAIGARGVEVQSLAGSTSLADFICAIAACRVLLTNDSGGMHVAAAAGVPTVAVFGPTIEEETGPLGAHTRVIRQPVECSPCMLKDCPIDHRCMTGVSPQRVSEAARELVQLG
ncbi:MAG: lipopolysaccharide heptosyltransferase II [Bryobacterales bacterium]|jgi:heptosyltransferase-2|nr:lipopolysaccharide heptosyltransferase II [Bryobacterales bacterium]